MNAYDERKRVYIAGPMTGYKDWNFPAFYQVADMAKDAGYRALNPAENGGVNRPWAWNMRNAITLLMTADAITLLPGWMWSRGARIEAFLAWVLGMEFISIYDLQGAAHERIHIG